MCLGRPHQPLTHPEKPSDPTSFLALNVEGVKFIDCRLSLKGRGGEDEVSEEII